MTAKSPPKTLSSEARRIWFQMNRLFEFEYETMLILKTALEHYDIMMKARQELLDNGFSIPAQQDGEKSNPALQVMNTARDGFLKAWKFHI